MSSSTLDCAQIRRHFSAHADEYDRYAKVQKNVADQLVCMAAAEPIHGAVLDVGTGTGAVGARLLQSHPDLFLTVSDLAHDMTLAACNNLPGSVAVDADAHRLPFQANSFGLVVSASVYQWVEDLDAAFWENYRILKPGGRLAFALFSSGTLTELETVFRHSLQSSGSERSFHFQSFPDEEMVRAALQGAGFGQIEAEVRHEIEYHDSFRDLLVGLKKIGAQNASVNRPTGLFPRTVLSEMERMYHQQYSTQQGLRATYSVLYGVGQKPWSNLS
jgi:malonyl-CoA O-methyltransferase